MNELGVIGIFSSLGFSLYLILLISLGYDDNKEDDIRIIRANKWLHPNSICIERVILSWAGTYFYFFASLPFLRYLGIACVTISLFMDAIDGLIARTCDLETEMGKWLDPLCDKLVCLPILVLFSYFGSLELWLVLFLVITESTGQFGRRIISKRGGSIAANDFGKIKMVVECALIVYCVLLNTNLGLMNNGNELLVICIALSVLSFVTKLMPENWQVRFGFFLQALTF